jgi:hypothetical protein
MVGPFGFDQDCGTSMVAQRELWSVAGPQELQEIAWRAGAMSARGLEISAGVLHAVLKGRARRTATRRGSFARISTP